MKGGESMKRVGRVLGLVSVFAIIAALIVMQSASYSFAALTFPTVTMDDVTTIAAGMLGLLCTVWALKRALGFLGR